MLWRKSPTLLLLVISFSLPRTLMSYPVMGWRVDSQTTLQVREFYKLFWSWSNLEFSYILRCNRLQFLYILYSPRGLNSAVSEVYHLWCSLLHWSFVGPSSFEELRARPGVRRQWNGALPHLFLSVIKLTQLCLILVQMLGFWWCVLFFSCSTQVPFLNWGALKLLDCKSGLLVGISYSPVVGYLLALNARRSQKDHIQSIWAF